MTAATIVRTPQLHSASQLAAAIRADFLDRGIPAAVEIGEWSPEVLRGAPRVIIEIADGKIGQPAGHWQPGLQVRVNETPEVIGPVVATLDPASTITHARTGTATASGSFVIRFETGGVTGIGSDIEYALSVDNDATFEGSVPLDADTSIEVYGSTFALGTGTVATAGDLIAWTQTRATFQLSRPRLDRAAGFLLRIHAPDPTGKFGAVAAQDATAILVGETALAISRALMSPFREDIREHWPKTFPNYPAFVRGSMCELSLVVGVPLLDDALGRGVALEATLSTGFDFQDGTESPADTVTIPIQ